MILQKIEKLDKKDLVNLNGGDGSGLSTILGYTAGMAFTFGVGWTSGLARAAQKYYDSL